MPITKFFVATSALVLLSTVAFADPASNDPSASPLPVVNSTVNAPVVNSMGSAGINPSTNTSTNTSAVNAPTVTNSVDASATPSMPSVNAPSAPSVNVMPAPVADEPKAPVINMVPSNVVVAPTSAAVPSTNLGMQKQDDAAKAPSPSKSDVESILAEVDGQDPIKVSDLFAKEGFSFITPEGEVLKSMSDIGGFIAKGADNGSSDLSFKVSSLQELANGSALAIGGFTSGDQNSPEGQKTGSFTSVLSYNGADWKVVSLQLTETLKADAHDHDHGSNTMGMILAAVIGAVAGFLGSRFLNNRSN